MSPTWRAVADRTVDAQENPLTNLVNFNIHAHHRHVSLTGHLLGIALLLVNRARYDALPDEPRRMLDAAAGESEVHQRALAVAEDAECLSSWPMPASRSSDPTRSTFRGSAQPQLRKPEPVIANSTPAVGRSARDETPSSCPANGDVIPSQFPLAACRSRNPRAGEGFFLRPPGQFVIAPQANSRWRCLFPNPMRS